MYNLLSTFKKLLTLPAPVDNTTKPANTPDAAALFIKLQTLCDKIPGGKARVHFNNNQLDLQLTWDGAHYMSFDNDVAFTINGGMKVETETKMETKVETKIETEIKTATVPDTVHTDTIPTVSLPAVTPDMTQEMQKRQIMKRSMMFNIMTFLKSHYVFRFNTLTARTEFAKVAKDKNLTVHTSVYKSLTTRNLNGITCAAMNEGLDCWDKDIKRYIESDNIKSYNPFSLYMDTLPKWDGKDRVTPFAKRVSDDGVWTKSFHRWMLAMTAAWMNKDNGTVNSVAPLLVSSRQGLGKSTFCRMIMPKELACYFTENYDLDSPNAAELKLASCGLINIDEFDRLPKKKLPLLKNLMQTESLNMRRAYQHYDEPMRRIASFIGTSNRHDLLTDASGSRRFICVEINHMIDCSPVDYAQMYAQLKEEIEGGKRYWFSKQEEYDIQRNNRQFYARSAEEDVFNSCFRMAEEGEDNARLLSATEICEIMKKRHPSAMRGITSEKVSRMLPQLATRIHTKYGNGYNVVSV